MTNSNQPSDDNSAFLTADGEEAAIDLGSIFSSAFSNIKSLYRSAAGSTQLFTATRYGKRFVLKGLKGEYAEDPLFRLALAKEFEIGFSLDHPSIRRTVSLESVGGLGEMIVLEHIDGRNLESLLASGSLSVESGRAICREIAEGLSYLHGKRILHRDLKPSNILITHNGGAVKIIDFNLSDSDSFIILKNPAGSGKYMAPELFLPDAVATPETDIYSLGEIAKEIADITDDFRLKAAAEACMADDMSRRNAGIIMIRDGSLPSSAKQTIGRTLDSSRLTYALIAICSALALFIALHYINA